MVFSMASSSEEMKKVLVIGSGGRERAPNTLATAGMHLTSEVMMIFIPGLRESSRSGRSTRSVRSERSCLSCGTLSPTRRGGVRS